MGKYSTAEILKHLEISFTDYRVDSILIHFR